LCLSWFISVYGQRNPRYINNSRLSTARYNLCEDVVDSLCETKQIHIRSLNVMFTYVGQVHATFYEHTCSWLKTPHFMFNNNQSICLFIHAIMFEAMTVALHEAGEGDARPQCLCSVQFFVGPPFYLIVRFEMFYVNITRHIMHIT
jgi:hypothetical protein